MHCLNCTQCHCLKTNENGLTTLFVGLSAKPNEPPLSYATNTGKIVKLIEDKLGYNVLKTNLVKCAPLDKSNKLRYPTKAEKENCYQYLKEEIETLQPLNIVLLGKQVQESCGSKIKKDFPSITILNVEHPSYIYVYKRKYLEQYIENIVTWIKNQ